MQFSNNLSKNFTNFKYNKFNPSVNEWINSIYTFDKKSVTFINDKLDYDLVNSYFNARPFYIKKTTYRDKRVFNNKSFLSLNRIFVSMPEFKHSMQNLNLVLYIFNKEEILLLKKINKLKKLDNLNGVEINKLSSTLTNNVYNVNNIYSLVSNNLKARYYKIFLYKNYLAKLYFNKSVFNFSNLLNLKKILYSLHKTEINISIVNLKYLHLDNNLFVDAITRKLKDRNKRVLRVLRNALILPKIPLIDNLLLINKKIFNINNVYNNLVTKAKSNLIVFKALKGLRLIRNSVYEGMKNTHIVGIRLEGKGRLTRRLTASRAVYKIAYLGSLRNIYSSFQGLPSTVNRGFEKSSINYNIMNSNNRNGSFGIKSWQNTM